MRSDKLVKRSATAVLLVLAAFLLLREPETVLSSAAPASSDDSLSYIFEIAKLSASDGQSGDRLGISVDIDGDTLVAGAYQEDGGPGDPNPLSGAVYVYERDLGGISNWGQAAKLNASDADGGDLFGTSVAIHGDTIAVGAYLEDGGEGDPITDAGAVYIFERDLGGSNNWGQAAKITAGDSQEEDFFGVSVALHEDILAVGANLEDGGAGDPQPDAGAVYIFDRDLGGLEKWGQAAKLAASDAQSGDYFGMSVALTGGILVAGAIWEDGGAGDPLPSSGAAYVFEAAPEGQESWIEITKLIAEDAESGDYFGVSVAINQDTVIVGAFTENGSPPLIDAGAAYVFERDHGGANNWGQAKKLIAQDAKSDDLFGVWTAIQADIIFVGAYFAPGEPSNPLYGAGAVYVFERNHGGMGNWGQSEKLMSSDAGKEDHFGGSLAFNGDTLVVGAYRDDGTISNSDMGAAYVFRRLNAQAHIPIVSSCLALYSDDFSNPNSGWPVEDDGNVLLGYLNGEYRVRILEPFWTVAVRPGPSFTDFLLSATVRSFNTNDGTFGLVFGLNSDFTEMYTFEIDSQQGYELWRLNGDWVLLRSGTSNELLPGLNTNKLAVERDGNKINLFANGTLIDGITDSNLSGLRHVGVIASNSDEGTLDIRFDNFEVLPIGCGLSMGQAVASNQEAFITGTDSEGFNSGEQNRR